MQPVLNLSRTTITSSLQMYALDQDSSLLFEGGGGWGLIAVLEKLKTACVDFHHA
jgi:hypothetical protein